MNGVNHMSLPSGARCGDTHFRQQQSILARTEKQLLIWLARRLPSWVSSDHLSLLGLASMLGVGMAFAAARWSPTLALSTVPILLALNWFGDSLDGTLARVRRLERPRYGFYVDHVIDLAGTAALLTGLGCSGLMHPLIAAGVLVAFLLVSAESYLTTYARGVFAMSFLGFGPTELRILLAIGAIRLLWGSWVTPFGIPPVRLLDLGGTVAILGLMLTFFMNAARNTRALYREETR